MKGQLQFKIAHDFRFEARLLNHLNGSRYGITFKGKMGRYLTGIAVFYRFQKVLGSSL